MEKVLRFFCAFLFVLLFIGINSMAEEVTLTTYYPAPYGNYVELQATKLAVGPTVAMPINDGDLAVETSIWVNGTQGDTGAYVVVSSVRLLAGPILQKRTRTVTVEGGVITSVSAESAWSAAP